MSTIQKASEAGAPDLSRWGVVNAAELSGLAHFPTKEVNVERLERTTMKSKLPPELYTTSGVVLGESAARGITKTVTLPERVRDRHCYVVGKSGTGKSTLIFNMALQTIQAGDGVAVIDPHGDLVDELLHAVPEERIADTIYFNAADREYPIGLNVLNAQDDSEVQLLEQDLLVTFRRLTEGWGPQMDRIVRYCLATLLRMDGVTFLDINQLLKRPEFQAKAIRQVRIPDIQEFWRDEYPDLYKRGAAQPILNRMTQFVRSEVLSGIIGQDAAPLSIFDVMQNSKVLLVKLPPSIGADTQKLLGSLLVSQFQLAAMRRAGIPKEERTPFFLFVDEFQHFSNNDSFEQILSEARKYQLCLTLAHQFTSQLEEGVKKAIFGNVGTMVVFQVGKDDAYSLRNEMGMFEQEDLINLEKDKHEVLCRPMTKAADTFKFRTFPAPPKGRSYAEEIIDHTRDLYSTYVETEGGSGPGPEPEPKEEPKREQGTRSSIFTKRPAAALPKEFADRQEEVLYYVNQAEYLTQKQIITLCYRGRMADTSVDTAASRDLRDLVKEKKLKVEVFGPGKVYFTGRTLNATKHNVLVRDLYIKILRSGFELADCKFFVPLGSFAPDLYVSFLASDEGMIPTYWELDTGTEGMAELQKKVANYQRLASENYITFVVTDQQRLDQLQRNIKEPWVRFAVLDEFSSLTDPVFRQNGASDSFFTSDERE